MRKNSLLIDQVRRQTENVEFTDGAGISDEEMIQYINDGQDRIYSLINQTSPEVFLAEKTISAVADQEAYDIPFDAFMDNRIYSVEYTTSTDSFYYQLKQGRFHERLTYQSGTPSFYIRRAGQILLQPKPQSTGTIRLTYVNRPPTLDLSRGTVSAVTLNSSNNTITSLTLATSSDFTTLDLQNHFTIVNRNGVVQMSRIEFDSIDTSTGVVTVNSSFVYETGETIAVGDTVCTGEFATTHSQLKDNCERYLIHYAAMMVLQRDSSNDWREQSLLVDRLEQDIVQAYAEADTDVDYIPILDNSYLDSNEDSY